MTKEKSVKYGYLWLSLAACGQYAAGGVYTYLSMYLKTGPNQFSNEQVGILLALGQIVASVMPLLWGYLADRSKNRNTVWMIVIAGTALSALLVPVGRSFFTVALALLLVNCFQSSYVGMQDSVSTELCSKHRWDLGRSRVWGTLVYAVSTYVVGAVLSPSSWEFFAVYSCIFALILIPVWNLPVVPGYQDKKHRVPIRRLFEDKSLVFIFGVTFVFCLTTSFYYSFFSVYFISEEVGGTSRLFGICNALASLAEFPGIFFLSKAIKKHGLERVMAVSLAFLALRWLLIGLVPNPYALIVINMLHGVSYPVAYMCVIIYINEKVLPEFRATAQGVNTVLLYGLTRVIASLSGGYLSSAFSFSAIFVVMGFLVIAVTAVYVAKTRCFARTAKA